MPARKHATDAHGLAYRFIAHDRPVVRPIADRVAVMYPGRGGIAVAGHEKDISTQADY